MGATLQGLPPGVTVLERGWLSSNNIVIQGKSASALVDSGYETHAPQTLALVQAALQGRPLNTLVNTHLHSDHCGGNAALKLVYPDLQTWIPPGLAEHVAAWDPHALSYAPTGQNCPVFQYDDVLLPGSSIRLGDLTWQVHAAPGHDPHSVILFQEQYGVLLSADALWEQGFGVVFPELDGERAFEEVSDTLDLIESLQPRTVVPGHGAPFTDVTKALAVARQRLDGFIANPDKHLRYASKVLLKFKLLELQSISRRALQEWAQSTAYFTNLMQQHYAGQTMDAVMDQLVQDLVRSGAALVQGEQIINV
jgi:glyoxylase-like metal-dependent hydrolase (beta-lactamase superfamily II)